ncbi:hypothetical protein PENTCL1PPCAC_26789 [Pristionchus entomophagus]|uniref:Aspartyl/asparaginy/proline hydroxylase domain-containing protein n=1 Tax=Pristionchus entomophagus TaxID=358040 RepID=A0AAV5UE72_9BILA|nr:hypothetical protein PENTCL1PPCAC_26789 [Pristionchus entomophagus]
MAAKVANGMNGAGTARAPFRRQGSSVQGGHPLAVAVLHQNPVDYSVTKGGARTWIVLLVFGLLCTSLYSLVQTEEGGGRNIADFDDDDDSYRHSNYRSMTKEEDHADDDDDGDDESVHEKTRHRISDQKRKTTPTPTKKTKKEEEEEEAKPSADDDEDEEENVEETMLAGLRRKVEERLRSMSAKKKREEKEIHTPPQPLKRAVKHGKKKEEKEEEVPTPSRRQEKKVEEEEENEDEDEKNNEEKAEEEEEEEEEPKARRGHKKKMESRRSRRSKRVEKEEEEEEEEEEEKENEDEKEEKKVEVKEEKKEELMEEIQLEDDDEKKKKREEDGDEDDEEKLNSVERRKQKRSQSHITSEAPSRPCKRKHCPPSYEAAPRKNLLLKKRKQDDDDDEEEDDDTDDNEIDYKKDDEDNDEAISPPPPPPIINEVVALRKHRASERETYVRRAITNRDDHKIRSELDDIDRLLDRHHLDDALRKINGILKRHPDSPRAIFSKARAYDLIAEAEEDDEDVDEAIKYYEEVLEEDSTPGSLFRQAAARLADRARFRGQLHVTLNAQRAMIDRFPSELKLQSDMALTFLVMGRYDDARKVLTNVLSVDPSDGYALVYRGLVSKLIGDVDEGVLEMKKGLRALSTNDIDLTDARVYYHLGEGLMQLGRRTEAYAVYEHGAELGLFLSAYQRSSHNIDGLKAQSWWNLEQTSVGKHLKGVERQWVSIRHEALGILESHPREFTPISIPSTLQRARDTDEESLSEFELFDDGEWHDEHCAMAPLSCQILEDFTRSSNASKSSMSFVILRAGTRIPPLCGASNTRLVAELGLIVPSEARIRVGKETRGWKTGHFIVYDDSFEHELWIEGAASSAYRLVLSIDLWHPEVPVNLRRDNDDEDD